MVIHARVKVFQATKSSTSSSFARLRSTKSESVSAENQSNAERIGETASTEDDTASSTHTGNGRTKV